jgi:hypothetical protein
LVTTAVEEEEFKIEPTDPVPLRLISRALPQAFTQMTDYMTSASSSTTNTSPLTSVPNLSQNALSLFLQTANAGDQPNTRDDAGLPIVYGSCKLLDMLGYGSVIASTNTGKAAITEKYLGVGESGYWNKDTGRESALLDQSKEYQELKNLEFAGRLSKAQEAQILLDSEAQQVLNKYLDEQQQADLFIKGQTLANLYAQGALTEAQYKSEMVKAVKLSVEINGLRIQNRIAEETADSLIYANIHANRSLGLSSS